MDRRVKEQGTLSYISTDSFNNNFFNYVITSSAPTFIKVGSLVTVTGATSVNCPAGNVLRENGKKLYPGAHSGVTTYMVGVFDIVSGLKGYINPNDPMFAPYNTDRPLYQLDSVYTTDGSTKNLGPSVLTLGHIAASGDVTSPGDVTVGGHLFLNSGNTGVAAMTNGSVVGSFRKLTVTATYCKTGSIIMLTYAGQNGSGILSAENITNGSFKIVSSNTADLGVVMYLIVN